MFANPQPQNDPALAVRTIQGTVVDADGKFAAGCQVDLYFDAWEEMESTTCDDQGNFAFTVAESITYALLRARNLDETMQAIQLISIIETERKLDPSHLQLESILSTEVIVRRDGKIVPNAIVAGLVKYNWPMIQGRTDDNGQFILRTPVSFPVESIWAVDTVQGVAFWYPDVAADTVERARQNQPAELTLDLLPKRTCVVKVVGADGKSVAGVEIFPYFRIERDSNRKYLPQLRGINAKTSEAGIARFDWLPAEPVNWFIPTLISEEFREIYDEESNEDLYASRKTLKIGPVPKKYPVYGSLVGPENANLQGVKIFGDGMSADARSFNVTSGEDGRFKFDAIPGSIYDVAAMHPDWASDIVSKVLLDPDGTQSEEFSLTVYPATNVTISVTRGMDHTPVVRGDVIVEHISMGPRGVPTNTLRQYLPLTETGQVTFGIGRGKWNLKPRSGKWSETKEIVITDSTPLDIYFHEDWMGENLIAGQLSGPPNAEAPIVFNDAIVEVINYSNLRESFETHPNAGGNWSLNADVAAQFAVVAFSGDKRFGSLKMVHAPDELPVNMELAPTTTISGTLVDGTGYPFAGKEIVLVYEVVGNAPAHVPQVHFGSALTNDDGKFQMGGVITRVPLKLAVMRGGLPRTDFGQSTIYQPGEAVEGVRLTMRGE